MLASQRALAKEHAALVNAEDALAVSQDALASLRSQQDVIVQIKDNIRAGFDDQLYALLGGFSLAMFLVGAGFMLAIRTFVALPHGTSLARGADLAARPSGRLSTPATPLQRLSNTSRAPLEPLWSTSRAPLENTVPNHEYTLFVQPGITRTRFLRLHVPPPHKLTNSNPDALSELPV